MKKQTQSFRIAARLKSFKYAFNGLKWWLLQEHNARIHLVAAILVIALSVWLKIEKWEWVVILSCIALVWMAELFNSAIEALADVVSPDLNDHIKRCKDMAAAAVLVVSLLAFILGLIVFVPYIRIFST